MSAALRPWALVGALDHFAENGMAATVLDLQRLGNYGVKFHSFAEPPPLGQRRAAAWRAPSVGAATGIPFSTVQKTRAPARVFGASAKVKFVMVDDPPPSNSGNYLPSETPALVVFRATSETPPPFAGRRRIPRRSYMPITGRAARRLSRLRSENSLSWFGAAGGCLDRIERRVSRLWLLLTSAAAGLRNGGANQASIAAWEGLPMSPANASLRFLVYSVFAIVFALTGAVLVGAWRSSPRQGQRDSRHCHQQQRRGGRRLGHCRDDGLADPVLQDRRYRRPGAAI